MPGILYFYDADGRFLRWNRSFETVSGYSREEIAHMHPAHFFSSEDQPRVAQRIGEVFAKGESSVEASFVTKDGRGIPYFFTGRRVQFEDRMCLVGVGIDISIRRRAEDRLAESERKYRRVGGACQQHHPALELRGADHLPQRVWPTVFWLFGRGDPRLAT